MKNMSFGALVCGLCSGVVVQKSVKRYIVSYVGTKGIVNQVGSTLTSLYAAIVIACSVSKTTDVIINEIRR